MPAEGTQGLDPRTEPRDRSASRLGQRPHQAEVTYASIVEAGSLADMEQQREISRGVTSPEAESTTRSLGAGGLAGNAAVERLAADPGESIGSRAAVLLGTATGAGNGALARAARDTEPTRPDASSDKVDRTESLSEAIGFPITRLSDAHGQHVATGPVGLTADLTSPITEGALVRYEAEYHGLLDAGVSFEFTLTGQNTGDVIRRVAGPESVAQLKLPGAGRRYRIQCRVLRGTSVIGSASLDQVTVAADPRVPRPWFDQDAAAVAELINNFRRYVTESAAATGGNGISALFLAALLRVEIANTPALPLISPARSRDREIDGVDETLGDRERGRPVSGQDLDRSVGVGQIKLSTAAMATGATPWIEQDRNERSVGRAEARENFLALPTVRQREILTLLRWPRSNIATTAQILAHLKNRENRYPGMSRAAFASSERATKIIASEYQLGGSTSPEALAQPTEYGDEVWQNMHDAIMQQFFPA